MVLALIVISAFILSVAIFLFLHYERALRGGYKLAFDFEDIGTTAAKAIMSLLVGIPLGFLAVALWQVTAFLISCAVLGFGVAYALKRFGQRTNNAKEET